MQPNEKGTQKDLVLYRIETSKSDIKAAEILLEAKEFRPLRRATRGRCPWNPATRIPRSGCFEKVDKAFK